MSRWDLSPEITFEMLADAWVRDLAGQVSTGTQDLYRMHMHSHLLPHFGAPEGITSERIAQYGRDRLKAVKRRTLVKERSTLRGFLGWCQEQGYLLESPTFPALSKRAQGTAYKVRRRGNATPMSPEEARALVEALPVWSQPRKGVEKFLVRARFIVMYETALRPATLDALRHPEHYTPGADTLLIEDEMDKARFGRVLPLNKRAQDALSAAVRGKGPIFGRHNYRHHLERAAARVLDEDRARTFCAYDLRHARLTELAAKGDLTGVAYLAGHKHVTTTSIYIKPGLKAAREALDKAGVVVVRRGRVPNDRTESEQLPASMVRRGGVEPPRPKTLEPEPADQKLSTAPEVSADPAVAALRAADVAPIWFEIIGAWPFVEGPSRGGA